MCQANISKPYVESKIICLPFVNLPPSSEDAIFSVIQYAVQNRKFSSDNQSCTFLTFDQPLYWKAHSMLTSSEDIFSDANVILQLGGFHLLMSFMGAVGHIMGGSGLQEVWSTIYAPNVASYLLGGHSFARALRAHFITQLALGEIIFENCNLDPEIVENTHEIADALREQLDILRERGDTSALWVQYFHLVTLMRNFIEAERSGTFRGQ